jgi:hypothetical protein
MLARLRQAIITLTRGGRRAPRPDAESGQSLIILALAFLGLIAMLGLALDLGLVYIERVRVKRAVDAATLAGVVELPYEEDAIARAIEYLNLNGYNIDRVAGDANVYVVGCIETSPGNYELVGYTTPYTYIQAANPRTSFTIAAVPAPGTDPADGCGPDPDDPDPDDPDPDQNLFGNANRLAVTGTIMVNMNFMQFFGFSEVPVQDDAVAQNVTDLDVTVVFDISGSMEFFTVCTDCWVRTGPTNPDYPNNGYYNPIPSTVVTSSLCEATQQSYVDGTNRYMIAEAELASFNPPLWETRYRQAGQGYWAIQRGSRSGDFNNRAGDTSMQSANVCRPGTGVDCSVPGDPDDHLCDDDPGADVRVDCSGYVSHRPYVTYGQAAPPAEQIGMFYYLDDVLDNDPAPPRIEYYFTPDWSGTTYVWIRAQGGGSYAFEPVYQNPFTQNKSTVHWDVQSSTDGFNPQSNAQAPGVNYWRDNRADPSLWRWIRLGSASTTANETFKLTLWAGSPGYDIDKIVVTNDSRSSSSSIPALTYDGGRGRPATRGSATRAACDPCNPIYGLSVTPDQCTGFSPVLTPTNNLANPLFGDQEPLRTSKEAVKRFMQRLEPQFDQAGFVPFTTNVTRADQGQLDCVQREGEPCYQGSSPISYTRVLASVEKPTAQHSTSIAEGMRNGLEVLGVNVRNLADCPANRDPYTNNCFDNTCDRADRHDSCGRGGAASRVMVVLTDGSPNENPGGCGNDPVYNFPYENDDDYDCVIYYAGKALQNNVVVYTIGLGQGARGDLLEMAADTARGRYYFAATPDELDGIFDEILSSIYVRLIR